MSLRARRALEHIHTRVNSWLRVLRRDPDPQLGADRSAEDTSGWGALSAEDLRAQGITPGMKPPDSDTGPRAVAMPPRRKRQP